MIEVFCRSHSTKFGFSEIVVNEETFASIATSQLRNQEFTGSYATFEDWLKIWEEWEYKRIKALAYDRLSRRCYFSYELKKTIFRYGYSLDRINLIIEELQKKGYLNDKEQVEGLIQKGIRRKKSLSWIQYYLRQKGGKEIEFNPAKTYTLDIQEQVIRDILIKNQKKGKKSIAIALRKGFSYEDVICVYNSLK